MPIAGRWRKLSNLPAPRGRDAMPGVYELADAEKRTIYIGQSARDVPNRLRQHLSRPSCVRGRACYWRYEYSRVPQADEAELPPCNRATPQLRDAQRRYAERTGGD